MLPFLPFFIRYGCLPPISPPGVTSELRSESRLPEMTRSMLARPWLVCLLLVLLLFLLRLPSALVPHELDADESQGICQGMKFLVNPIPWKAVDGGSWGPLNSYLIL